jgi:glycosyltransferase involved in cell wall biosynthesis
MLSKADRRRMVEQLEEKSQISVIVPVFNSGDSLDALVKRLESVLQAGGYRYELILVNDGSRDNSWQVIADLSQKYAGVRGINLMRNYGQHNALLCGLREAKFPVSVTMDDDLQHPPARSWYWKSWQDMMWYTERQPGSSMAYGATSPQPSRALLYRAPWESKMPAR